MYFVVVVAVVALVLLTGVFRSSSSSSRGVSSPDLFLTWSFEGRDVSRSWSLDTNKIAALNKNSKMVKAKVDRTVQFLLSKICKSYIGVFCSSFRSSSCSSCKSNELYFIVYGLKLYLEMHSRLSSFHLLLFPTNCELI